ncbi:dihydroxyacetone kinase subunit DhaL [Mangrovihabitans endophyticus]|uniref:dihydroxyacetone kinase subunit DhaL n=1 Tax=Mangrovihabitans endophyticus TaxID=1751298 RepID=UPI00166888B3|nr:dihydroxyacetone kinase subunit DhaL [Mangrovihabitans endophyticus]
MKKLINDAGDVVGEALDGLTRTCAGIARLAGSTTAVRADVDEVRAAGQVTLLSGGGAGHEPAHAGYVGPGMLTAAVAGEVFTSPSVDAVLDGIRAVASPAGVLLIVKNYTGDRLNFGLAAELARAEGIDVATVVVGDDVALAAEAGAGRRGLAGTVLVHKVAGATAATGAKLDKVAAAAQRAADAVGTMGVALSPCTVPAAGQPGFMLDVDEIEWGLGIHGEPGVERADLRSAAAVAQRLVEAIADDRGIGAGQRVAVLANGLGATPPMELSIVADAAARCLTDRGIVVARIWAGNFLTALDMSGCSISVLPVDDALLAALDAPTSAPAWPQTVTAVEPAVRQAPPASDGVAGTLNGDDPVRRALEAAAETLISARDELTELDREVGDGDMGISLARGAAAVLAECPAYPGDAGPAAVLRAASATVRRSVGGTSGPLYAVLLLRAAASLEEGGDWATAFRAAVAGVCEVGGADVGDRTMVDALAPAAETFSARLPYSSGRQALTEAAEAAATGAAATADIRARLGRSSYLGDRVLGRPDPGAEAVARWLAAVAHTLDG